MQYPFACLLLLFTVPMQAALAQFHVASVAPANNARGISPAATVTLTFASPVDALTVTPQNIRVAGRWSGPVPGLLTVGAGGTTVTFAPLRPLFAAEIATLMVSRAVTSATGQPLSGGFMSIWWVDVAPSSGNFVLDHVVDYRRPGEGPVRTYGFFAGDVDRDGSPDMSATNEVSFDVRLMKNSGCGQFGPLTVTSMPAGEEPSPNEGADFNGDGWLDLATGNQNGQSVAIFLNDAAGNYLPPVVIPVGGPVHGIAVLDAEGDGDIDIVATNQTNIALLRNNGNGTFAAPTFFDGGGNGEWSIQVGDANGDGKPDIFCGTFLSANVTVLLGSGTGTFAVSVVRPCGGFPWQMALGDINNDGNIDCVIANRSISTAGVMLGNGAGGLASPTNYPVGSTPISVDIGDLEGDDDLDIVVASFHGADATLLRNNGAGVFGNATSVAATASGSCAVIVDYDRDGDTDVILVDELDDKGFVYRQVGPNPAGVQPPSCDGALRINGFANRGGYGAAPLHPLPGGRLAFLNVSGQPGQLMAVFGGAAQPNGVPSPFGLLNLDLGLSIVTFVSGFGGDPRGVLDSNGETTIVIPVPVGLLAGVQLAMQCLVTTPTGFVVTNPEVVVF